MKDESKQKFARAYKVAEFTSKKLVEKKDIDEVDEEKEKKKQLKRSKRKHSKISTEESGDGKTENSSVSENIVIKEVEINESNDENISGTSEIINESEINDHSRDDRTVFVGNLSIKETSKSIQKIFEEFGEIENLRLRSVPVAGTAVDENGNHNLMKKVCVNTRKFGDQKGSLNAYIVYKRVESVTKALELNNQVINNRHIRVDKVVPTLFDPKRSVFLGNLPHYGDEEDLRNYFANALPKGQDDIEGIRIVRDPNTLIGKGFGYLLLKDRDAVMEILKLNGLKFKNRFELRIMICAKRTKKINNSEKNHDSEVAKNNTDNRIHKYYDNKNNKQRNVRQFDFQQKRPKSRESINPHAESRAKKKKHVKR